MVLHYLVSAVRKVKKAPFTSSVNILALALGFSCFVAAIGVSRYWQMSDSHFENSERIYVVTQQFGTSKQTTGQRPLIAQPVAPYLKEDFPALEAVARIGNKREWTVNAGTKKAALVGARADHDLLNIFNFDFVSGNPKTALDAGDNVIITQSAAKKLFGSESAIGQTISFTEDFNPTVTGVIKLPSSPSHMADHENAYGRFDFLYSWPTGLDENEWWVGVSNTTYILFPEDESIISPTDFRRQLDSFIERRVPADQAALAETSIDILPLRGLQARLIDLQLFEGKSGQLSITKILTLLGLLVLVVACINYANLSTAQAASHAKEVGMRKVLGADRWQILLQYWLEALLLTFVAAVIALALIWLGAPVLENWTQIDLRTGLFADFSPIGWITVLIFVVAFAASCYPVLILSRVLPVQALRQGSLKSGPRFTSELLVAVQFTVASLLLIILMVMYAQNSLLKERGLSPNSSNIVLLTDDKSRSLGYESLRTDLINNPQIDLVSYIDFMPWTDHENFLAATRQADGGGERHTIFYNRIGYDFFKMFDATLIAGRPFDRSRNDADSNQLFESDQTEQTIQVVIDRDLSEMLGFTTPATAVGQDVYFPLDFRQNFSSNPTLNIIGVVENMPLVFSASGNTANLYALSTQTYGYPLVKISGKNAATALDAIEKAVISRDPEALVKTRFVDDAFGRGFQAFNAINRAFFALSIIAFAISIMGLFGMAVFTASRRQHEIGIRKTLGSSATQIVWLLLKDFSKPVLIGNLIAWPIAYFGANIYLSTFIQKISLLPTPWIISLVITLSIAWLAVGGQAFRAARVQPSEVLRNE